MSQANAYNRRVRRLFIALMVCSLVGCFGTGCISSDSLPRPVVAIISPPDGAQLEIGRPFDVHVAAAATRGVALLEMRAGDLSTNALASQANTSLSTTFSARLPFTPTQAGQVVLLATAQDASGAISAPASVSVNIVERVALLTVQNQPADAGGSADSPAGACQPDADFVADITIPDNTPIKRKTPFVKTWRVRNSGSCAWQGDVVLVFVRGERMSAPGQAPVAATAPGATVDISVAFVSPDKPGVYTSTWQLRSPQGILFGKSIFAVIQVP